MGRCLIPLPARLLTERLDCGPGGVATARLVPYWLPSSFEKKWSKVLLYSTIYTLILTVASFRYYCANQSLSLDLDKSSLHKVKQVISFRLNN